MRSYLHLAWIMTLSVLFFQSCYDDADIWDAIKEHESRISSLEEQCKQMNVNISSIQYLMNAQVNGDYIISIKPYIESGTELGYVITFFRGGPVVIYHGKNGENGMPGVDGEDGKDGADASIPIIGVKKDSDGIYYWTVDGEWLCGENGEKIKAVGTDGNDGADGQPGENGIDGTDGFTPVIGVKKDSDGVYYWTLNGEWLQGEDGEKIKAVGTDGISESGDAACYFSDVEQTDDGYVIFTLANGTILKVPTSEAVYSHTFFSIIFENTDFVIGDIEELSIPFTLAGALGPTEIDAVVLSRRYDQTAEIEMIDESSGILHINPDGYRDVDVLVIASNNGRTNHKLITTREGQLYTYDYSEISGLGGTIEIPVTTNYEYEVVVPNEYSSWIHYVDVQTRTELRDEYIVMSISQNNEEYERYGVIELRDKYFGSLLTTIYVYQMPCELLLSVDRTQFEADGIDYVKLTVESGWTTITEGVEFYNDQDEPVEIEDFCFTTTTSGSYSIYAKYEGIVSNTVYLLAKDENTPEYIAVYGETGADDIECAVLGLDGTVMYYHQNDSVPEMISKISKFNNYTNEIEFVVNFDDEGRVSNILTQEMTIVLGNYHDNLVDAMIFTADGERMIIKDVDYGSLSALMTKSPSGIEIANLVVSGVATGLEIAAIASVGVAAAGPVSITMALIGAGFLAYDAATAFELIPEGGVVGDFSAQMLGHFGNLAEMGINVPNSRLEVMAALAGLAADYMGLAELFEDDSKHEIIVGEGTLNPSGCISVTLTWSGPADIDLHCDGPSGHIYYGHMQAGSGYLDNDNTSANGPETIYYSNPADGSYSFYIHYYAENSGVTSVDYVVTVNFFGETEKFSGTISGEGSSIHIKTVLVGGITNTRSMFCEQDNYAIDWNALPKKLH